MEKKKKIFDCVEMKHRGAEKVRRATEGMTREEELAFWERGTEELFEQQKALQQQNPTRKAQSHPD